MQNETKNAVDVHSIASLNLETATLISPQLITQGVLYYQFLGSLLLYVTIKVEQGEQKLMES
jgi:hypothetical protein